MNHNKRNNLINVSLLSEYEFQEEFFFISYSQNENPYEFFERDSLKQSQECNIPTLGEEKIQELHPQIMTTKEQDLTDTHSQRNQVGQFEEASTHSLNEEVKKRQDANDLAQNISSTGTTIVSKLLSNKLGKEVKNNIRNHFQNFLKEKAKLYSQIFLVFTHLFFLKNRVTPPLFSSFKVEMLKYLDKRMKMAEAKEEGKREALMKKIKANIDLLNYLFPLIGAQMDFQILRQLSQPLFQNRQAKQLNGPLDSAMRVYKQILEEL